MIDILAHSFMTAVGFEARGHRRPDRLPCDRLDDVVSDGVLRDRRIFRDCLKVDNGSGRYRG